MIAGIRLSHPVLSVMLALGTLASSILISSADVRAREKIRFAVGPYQPTVHDTRNAFEPFFRYVADKLGRDYELTVTNDWAGISVALANQHVDVAWMGPWGYVLAHHSGGAQAIATVKYDGKPFYHSIMLARPDLKLERWPEDVKGLRLSLADVGSTSGWLIPTFYFKSNGVDPKTFFIYRDGASHAANVTSVVNGQVDLASDFDRNFNGMVEKGIVKRTDARIVWTSDPLPNDPLVVRAGLDATLVKRIQTIVESIDEATAKAIMPKHYTGWVTANHASYKLIEDAGIDVGRIKPRP